MTSTPEANSPSHSEHLYPLGPDLSEQALLGMQRGMHPAADQGLIVDPRNSRGEHLIYPVIGRQAAGRIDWILGEEPATKELAVKSFDYAGHDLVGPFTDGHTVDQIERDNDKIKVQQNPNLKQQRIHRQQSIRPPKVDVARLVSEDPEAIAKRRDLINELRARTLIESRGELTRSWLSLRSLRDIGNYMSRCIGVDAAAISDEEFIATLDVNSGELFEIFKQSPDNIARANRLLDPDDSAIVPVLASRIIDIMAGDDIELQQEMLAKLDQIFNEGARRSKSEAVLVLNSREQTTAKTLHKRLRANLLRLVSQPINEDGPEIHYGAVRAVEHMVRAGQIPIQDVLQDCIDRKKPLTIETATLLLNLLQETRESGSLKPLIKSRGTAEHTKFYAYAMAAAEQALAYFTQQPERDERVCTLATKFIEKNSGAIESIQIVANALDSKQQEPRFKDPLKDFPEALKFIFEKTRPKNSAKEYGAGEKDELLFATLASELLSVAEEVHDISVLRARLAQLNKQGQRAEVKPRRRILPVHREGIKRGDYLRKTYGH